jgi:hypothetical protein
MRKKYLVVVAVAVLLAAAALAWLLIVKTSSKPPQILASIEVEGHGTILANGTPKAFWNLTKPFTLNLEAKPEKCWAFKGWLVNGSLYSVETSVALLVKGNTTVRAVFAAKPCVLFSVEGGGVLLVNGTPAPPILELEEPSLLALEAKPAVGFTPQLHVNGTLVGKAEAWQPLETLVRVGGTTNVTARFVETYYWVSIDPRGVEASVNGTPVKEPLQLRLPAGYTVEISSSCKVLNESHQLCPLGWRVSQKIGSVWFNRTAPYLNLTFTVVGDTILAANPGVTWRAPPPAKGGVIYNGTEVPSIAVHTMFLVFPPSGSYRYLGNGWWEIEGGSTGVGIYISIPGNWSKLVIEGTWQLPYPSAAPGADISVVVEHGEYHYKCGFSPSFGRVGTMNGSFRVVFPREILDLPKYPDYYQDPANAYEKYVWPKMEKFNVAFIAQATRSRRVMPGVKAGDVFIFAHEVKLRVRIVAEP